MNRLVFFLCVMMMCSDVMADFYQWTDSQGVVHFTDDQKNIPPKYRSQMKTVPSSAQGEASRPATKNLPAEESSPPDDLPYGGENEAWWRSHFNAVNAQLKAVQDQLVAKKEEQVVLRRKRVIYKKTSDRIAYNRVSDEIAQIEQSIKTLQMKLADLHKAADEVAVPADWRR